MTSFRGWIGIGCLDKSPPHGFLDSLAALDVRCRLSFELQDGVLTIVGDERPARYAGQTFEYASGVLCSVLEQKYGYFEARLKVPAGQGMRPAFWLLGKVDAPGVNEIDIHEILGHEPRKVYMTVHWGSDYGSGHESEGTSWVGPDFSADFHVFGLDKTLRSPCYTSLGSV